MTLGNMDAATEEESKRGGFLSYAGEVHALAIGIAAGFYSAAMGDPKILAAVFALALLGKGAAKLGVNFGGKFVKHEIRREPWYAIGGGSVTFALFKLWAFVPAVV